MKGPPTGNQAGMPDPDAAAVLPFGHFHDVSGAKRTNPGGYLHASANPPAPGGEKLDRLGIGHPLGV